jgi:hypothetical protein
MNRFEALEDEQLLAGLFLGPVDVPVENRLLAFEVDGALYGLPAAEVREVSEVGPIAFVPTLSRRFGGVMNWHGDALPVVTPRALLAEEDEAEASVRDAPGSVLPERVLVLSEPGERSPRLGIAVDRVVGLAEGMPLPAAAGALVVDRSSFEGRPLLVLDPRRVVARVAEIIEQSVR